MTTIAARILTTLSVVPIFGFMVLMVLPVGGLAAFQYYQKGLIDVKAAVIMAAFFFAGGYFGGKFATQIPQDILRKVFALMLVFVAVKTWFFDKQ